MKLLVLAGGFGTRLQSVVAAVPKALAPVGNTPFLQLQIEHWLDQGIKSFVFLLHHQADLIIEFLKKLQQGILKDCEVQWLVEPKPLDTGGAVAFAVSQLKLTGQFLVTNADSWLGAGIREILEVPAPAMAVIELRDASRYGRVQIDEKDHITAFHEKKDIAGGGWINAGLYHLNAEYFNDCRDSRFSLERDIFPAIASEGKLSAARLQTAFIDIGVPADYFRFCGWINSGRRDNL